MNFQHPTPKSGFHRSLRVLSILLVQHALGPNDTDAHSSQRLPLNLDRSDFSQTESRPYLKISGSRSLRFNPDPAPLPQSAPAAAMSNPPLPVAADTPSTEAVAESTVHHVTPDHNVLPAEEIEIATPPANEKPVLNIIPDDTRSTTTRHEDFLPYFRFPAGNDVTVIVPADVGQPSSPGSLPASSATYQQR